MKTKFTVPFTVPKLALAALLLAAGSFQPASAQAQGTAFTYQGRLNTASGPATGTYDLTFTLFNTNVTGTAASGTLTNTGTAVSNGLFTVTLDFGDTPYAGGASLWLQIGARTNGAATFSPLTPRQAVLPTPYAIYAESANATNLVGTIPAANLSAANLPGVALLGSANTFTSGNQIITGGNVGIGTTTPGVALQVVGQIESSGPVAGYYFLDQNNNADTWEWLATSGGASLYNSGYGGKPLTIQTNGKVGVGTTTPANLLDVQGSADFSGSVGIGTTSPMALTEMRTATPSRNLLLSGPGGGTYSFYDTTGSSYQWDIAGTTNAFQISRSGIDYPFTISKATGNVGIGTTTPSSLLTVNGSGSPSISLIGSGTNGELDLGIAGFGTAYSTSATANDAVIRQSGKGNLFLQTGSGAAAIAITTNNKVGIGTTTPQIGFDVNSPIYAQPAAQFGVANCGGDCDQTDYQEAIRLWNQNGLGQVGVGFLVGPGSFNSNAVPDVWIGTHYAASGNANDFKIATRTNSTATNLIDRVYINGTSGNVGIGTTTPAKKLEVTGSATGVPAGGSVDPSVLLRVLNTATDGSESSSDVAGIGFGNNSTREAIVGATFGYDFLDFYVAGVLTSPKMRILGNGDVGIGTTNPTNLLQVVNAYCNGSTWVNASDRNLKQDFASVDAAAVLEKIVALPIQSWCYKAQPGETHIGPVAQDFHAVFGLNGADDKHIATVDENGVALAAIQGLNQKLEQKDAKINELEARLEKLEQLINAKNENGEEK